MRRIVLVQQKGGAAKTTLCVHLAVASEQGGSKTAIVDTDPQASAAQVWGQARGGTAPPRRPPNIDAGGEVDGPATKLPSAPPHEVEAAGETGSGGPLRPRTN